LKGLEWTPNPKACVNFSTAELVKHSMRPTGLLVNRGSNGDLKHLTLINENKSVVPARGTYTVDPTSLIEFPGDKKVAKYLF
jgi:hypothetical protein